jgi:hypothetical protein
MGTHPKPTPMPTDEQKTGTIVKLCSGIEMATGIALIATPLIIFRLIFGVRLPEDAAVLGRLLGLAELCLALACWFSRRGTKSSSVRAFILYNLLVALYLVYLGAAIRLVGYLLWPACALHLTLAALPALNIRWVMHALAPTTPRRQ